MVGCPLVLLYERAQPPCESTFNKFCHEICPITTAAPGAGVPGCRRVPHHTVPRGVDPPPQHDRGGRAHHRFSRSRRAPQPDLRVPRVRGHQYTVGPRDARDPPSAEDTDLDEHEEEEKRPRSRQSGSASGSFFRLPCIIRSDFCTLSSPDVRVQPRPWRTASSSGGLRRGERRREDDSRCRMRLRANVVMVMKARENDKVLHGRRGPLQPPRQVEEHVDAAPGAW